VALAALPVVTTVVTALVSVPGPASAEAVHDGSLTSEITFVGSGSCSRTGPGDSLVGPVTVVADGQPHSSGASSSLRATAPVPDTDDTTDLLASTTTTYTATPVAGVLSRLDVVVGLAAQVVTSKGSANTCNTRAQAQSRLNLSFDLPAPRLVTVTVAAAGPVRGEATLSDPTFKLTDITAATGPTTIRSQTLLPAGTSQLVLDGLIVLDPPAPGAPQPTDSAGTVRTTVDVQVPGAATTESSTGRADKYVDLADLRGCAAGSVAATWAKRAGKGDHRTVKKAVFTVEGAKVATVKKPKKGQVTTLTGLPAGAVEVEVTLKLVKKKGAKGKPGPVTLTRSYLPCQ
jgi:hypothetical protein